LKYPVQTGFLQTRVKQYRNAKTKTHWNRTSCVIFLRHQSSVEKKKNILDIHAGGVPVNWPDVQHGTVCIGRNPDAVVPIIPVKITT